MQARLVYSYNSEGSRSEKIAGVEGATFRREVKTDREGRQVQLIESCDDGFLIYTEKYKHQPDGAVEVSKYDHYNELLRVQRLKYEDGRLSEVAGPGDFLEIRTYFSGGRPKERKIYVKHKLASYESYAYTFDKFGNWIVRHTRRLTSETDEAGNENTDYREITYYAADGSGEGETTGVRPGSDSSPGAERSPPAVIRMSGGVLTGSAWRRVEPIYPLAAKSSHVTGSVVVEITIDECGRVVSSHALSGPAELREAAEHAARGWQFAQTKLNRIPVKVIGTITFHFYL